MIRKLLLAVLVAACTTSVFASYFKVNLWAEQGGNTVSVAGFTSTTNVQKSYPGATVTVYLTGTTTTVSIYADASGTTKANPFTAGNDGSATFYVADGIYDVKFSDCSPSCGLTTPWTITAVTVGGGGVYITVPPPSGGNDATVIQNIIDSAGNTKVIFPCDVTYLVNSELQVKHRNASIEGCGHNYNDATKGTVIKANASIRSVFAMGAGSAGTDASFGRISNIRFNANRLATSAMYVGGAGFSQMTNVYVENALVDGIYFESDAVCATCFNDTMVWTQPFIVSNGTFYRTAGLGNLTGGGAANDCTYQTVVTGTATLTASNATVTIAGSSTDLTTLGMRKGDLFLAGSGTATNPATYIGQIDHVINSTSLALQGAATNLPTAAQAGAGQPFGIAIGDGWHEVRSGNNNTMTIIGGLFRGNAASGIATRSLFGSTFVGPMVDNGALIAISIGDADNASIMDGGAFIRPYAESDIPWTFGFFQGQDIQIVSPTSNTGPQFGVYRNTTGAILRGDYVESIVSGMPQIFILTIRNNGGTIQSQFLSELAFGFLDSVQVARITGASATFTAVPTVSGAVDFANGVGILSGSTTMLLFNNTTTQPQSTVAVCTTTQDSTTTGPWNPTITSVSANVNGTTRQRTALRMLKADGTYMTWDVGNIAAGKQIVVTCNVRMR